MILQDQWGARGFLHTTLRSYLTVAAVAATFLGLWAIARRLRSPLDCFAILFAFWMCLIPLGYFFLDLTIVPQGSRYQLEFEMAVCLAFACLCAHLPWRAVVVGVLLVVGIRHRYSSRYYARGLICTPSTSRKPLNTKRSTGSIAICPASAPWFRRPDWLYNIFSDNPQLSAGHEPTAPNWMQRLAVYTIYTGTNAGDRDAEYLDLLAQSFR